MDVEQVRNKILVGRRRTCVVECALSRDFPGYVRTVQIDPEWDVRIEFEQYGLNEGSGADFVCRFSSLEDAIAVVEQYVNLPLSAWPRMVDYPDAVGAEDDSAEGFTRLKAAIAARAVPLPESGHWELHGEFWCQFLVRD